jgi:hypothetical protein
MPKNKHTNDMNIQGGLLVGVSERGGKGTIEGGRGKYD